WFEEEEDVAWRAWVDFKKREVGDLIGLLTADVRDSLKKRALFLLVVPSADFNPIYWTEEVGKYFRRLDYLKRLTPDLLAFVAELVTKFCDILRPKHCGRPQTVVEGDENFTAYMLVPDKYHDALEFYNKCILMLIQLLPLEQAEKIFPFYSLQDVSSFWSPDSATGYRPFDFIMRSNIDEKWKMLADAAMRKIILEEIAGQTKPREDWENALSCYANFAALHLFGKLPYSLELFAEQIQFIMDNRQASEHDLIPDYQVIKIFNLLPGDAYAELRHAIARYAVVEDRKDEHFRFLMYHEDQAVDWIAEEFGGSDPELADSLKALLKEGDAQQRERDAQQEVVNAQRKKMRETEENILAQMK
ncbi:MAG TPA: hypothetical protein VMQ48_00650, partial [Candidatus Saccharimonadales bacterium]|nr:hypothetical protein [Candidatus Saccharimonadales bacterium]